MVVTIGVENGGESGEATQPTNLNLGRHDWMGRWALSMALNEAH